MSIIAYERAMSRENKLWSPFMYSYPFDATQTTDRGMVYGLYADSYLNGHAYLTEIEETELGNLVSDYNVRIAELTTQEQIIIAGIVSSRYLVGIDKLIHDRKMIVKKTEISADDALWDAKMAALSSDNAALGTMIEKVASERKKTEARILELEAYIETEGINLSQVDIEIAEKETRVLRVDLQKLDTANQILKIQIDTVEKATQLIDIDLQMARIKVDSAHIDGNVAKIDLLVNDLVISQAQTTIASKELSVAPATVKLAQAKSAEMNKESVYHSILTSQESMDFNNKIALMALKQTIRLGELSQHKKEKVLGMENRIEESQLSTVFATEDSGEQRMIDEDRVSTMRIKVVNAIRKKNAIIAVAEKMAKANITSFLTHTIGKAE